MKDIAPFVSTDTIVEGDGGTVFLSKETIICIETVMGKDVI